jgi:hypothetical protein
MKILLFTAILVSGFAANAAELCQITHETSNYSKEIYTRTMCTDKLDEMATLEKAEGFAAGDRANLNMMKKLIEKGYEPIGDGSVFIRR